MKSYRQDLWMNVPSRRGYVNITAEVERAVRASGIREGLCLVNAMHITASVFINDNESGLHRDFERWLENSRRKSLMRSMTTISPAKTTATPT